MKCFASRSGWQVFFSAFVSVLTLSGANWAYPDDGAWIATTTGNWSDSANWQDGLVAGGAGFTATFAVDMPAAGITVAVDASQTIGNLTFGDLDPSTGGEWTLSGTGPLTLAGTTPTITVDPLASGATAVLSTVVAGTQGLTKLGGGTLTLVAANTYTGNTTVNAGQITVTGSITGTAGGSRFIIGSGLGANGAMLFDMGAAAVSTFYADGYGNSCDIGVNGGTGSLTLTSGAINVGTRTSGSLGSIRLGVNSDAIGTLVVNGGALNVPGRILMAANSGGAAATLTVNGGEVNLGTAGSGAYGDPGLGLLWTGSGTSTINLNGGTLALYSFRSVSAGTVNVNLNGGAIRAQNHNATFVAVPGTFNMNVQIGGAVFDTAGYSITLDRALLHDTALGTAADGGLTKRGGGTLTLTKANTYTGHTTVSAGQVTVTGSITGTASGSRFMIGNGSGTNGAMLFDMGAATVSTFYADGYTNSCDIGVNGGTGLLTLTSGAINIGTRTSGSLGSIRLGVNSDATGTLVVDGGTLNVPGRILMAANSAGTVATLTVNDGEVNLGTAGSGAYGDPGRGLLWTGAGTSTINLNGGALAMYGFHGGSGTANVNFDGGILRAQNNNATFVTTSGAFTMSVRAGGAVFDTAGYDITLGRALGHDLTLGVTPDGGLVKTGAGALTLTAANTYTGATTVNAGALLVNGALSTSSAVTVNDTATLGGTGTVGGNVSVLEGGSLAPGTSVGTLNVTGDLSFETGAFFDVEILGLGNADRVMMDGGLLTPGEATIRVSLGYSPEVGDSWTILDGEGSRDGIFNEAVTMLSGSELLDGWKWLEASYGGSVVLTVVPEPGTWLLALFTATCGLLIRRRRTHN